MSDFENVGKTSDFESGVGRAVPVDGQMVAVFRNGDDWYAIDDLCPHMGAPLSDGYLEGTCVTCPWHAWNFCIDDGKLEGNENISVATFEIKVENDEVWVKPAS